MFEDGGKGIGGLVCLSDVNGSAPDLTLWCVIPENVIISMLKVLQEHCATALMF